MLGRLGSMARPGASGPGAPAVLALSRFIRAGYDSRSTSMNEEITNRVRKLSAGGYASWFNAAMEYRMEIVANYGMNGDTTAGFNNRLSGSNAGAPGSGYNSSLPGTPPSWKGHVLDGEYGSQIPQFFFLGGGMNDALRMADGPGWEDAAFASGVAPGPTLGEQIDNTLRRLVDTLGGTGILFLPNGTPSHNVNNSGPAVHSRRRYIFGWPHTSPTMSAADKAKYGARVIPIDTWSRLAASENGYEAKSPRYMIAEANGAIDLAHMGPLGNREMAEAMADTLLPLAIAQGLPRRNQLPYSEADSFVGGALMNGMWAENPTATLDGQGGKMFTGPLPSGWTLTAGPNLHNRYNANNPLADNEKLNVVTTRVQVLNEDGVTYSEGIRLHIKCPTGIKGAGQTHTIALQHRQGVRAAGFVNTATSVAQDNMNSAAPGKVIAAGKKLRAIARLQFAADPKGLMGPGLQMQIAGTTQAINGGQVAAFNAPYTPHGSRMNDMKAYDKAVMTLPMEITQAFMDDNPSLRYVFRQFELHILTDLPIDIDMTISNFGIVERD